MKDQMNQEMMEYEAPMMESHSPIKVVQGSGATRYYRCTYYYRYDYWYTYYRRYCYYYYS